MRTPSDVLCNRLDVLADLNLARIIDAPVDSKLSHKVQQAQRALPEAAQRIRELESILEGQIRRTGTGDAAMSECRTTTHEEELTLSRAVERDLKQRIRELEDFARFMCKTWDEIDGWAHTRCDGDALMSYPMIQGTGNQMRLRKIGQQEHDAVNIMKAVEALEQPR